MSTNTYIPVLRNKANERQVMQTFGGLANFADTDYALDLHPLVEIESEDDLEELGTFLDAGDQLLVELPTYQTARSSDFGEAVQDTLDTHGDQVGFYLAHSDSVPVPVVSDVIERTPRYGTHSDYQQELEHQYSSIAHRLMVRGNSLSKAQRRSLRELAEVLRPTDRVLFDVVDNGFNDGIGRNLEFLAQAFDQQECAVLNLLNAFEDNSENLSPRVAAELGISGFGDFGINVRFPGGGGPTETVKIRHYHPDRGVVEEFEGESYAEASANLTGWDEWRSDHCDHCRTAAGMDGGNASDWKRVRTGHYITSMIRGEF